MEAETKDGQEVQRHFTEITQTHPDISAGVAAIQTLLWFLETHKMETIAEIRARLAEAIKAMTQSDLSVPSIQSGCEQFVRFITLTNIQRADFEEIQKILIYRGTKFLQKHSNARERIAGKAHHFVTDGATILLHGYSRVVMRVLKEATAAQKHFRVYVTQSLPDGAGQRAYAELTALDIPTTVILDASVGYIMEKVDMVLVGAESVVENGGIINKIGTFSIAIQARAMNKPFYAVAETFKFARVYPLNQQDLPNEYKVDEAKHFIFAQFRHLGREEDGESALAGWLF
nr:hypothetical protein BaRGS_014850 [Batillaria attramentaria]